LQLFPVVLQRLLVLLDDDLLGGRHIVELPHNLAQFPSIGHVLGLELADQLLTQFVQVDNIRNPRQREDVAEQLQEF
jgi:hypothetical protein